MANSETLFTLIRQRLSSSEDASFAEGQRRFFQHEIETYGVRQAQLTPLVHEVSSEVKRWSLSERNALMKLLWEDGKLESGVVACHVYRRFASQCTACEFKLFERWIDRYVRNWAHTDGVASWLVAACIANEPDLRFELIRWASSTNRWKRRAAAVSLLQEAKAGRHTTFILEIAGMLIDERDDMVEKGVGWLLKETYPRQPDKVVAFLRKEGRRASRLTLRYAAEKMSAADRALVLSR